MEYLSNRNISFGYLDQGLLNSLSAHICIIASDGNILAANKAWNEFARHNGVTNYAAIGVGANYFDACKQAVLNQNDFALKTIIGLKEVISGEKSSYELIYPCHRPDEDRWYKMNIRPIPGYDEKFIIVHENATERKQAQQELRKSQERYRNQFENSLDGIIISRPNGDIVDINPAACQMLQLSRREIKEKGNNTFIDLSDPKIKKALKKRERNGRFSGELEFVRGNGERFFVEVVSSRFIDDQNERLAATHFRDISVRKEAEMQLKHEKRFTDTVLNSLPGTFFLMDKEGKLLRWNKNLENEFGYNAEDIKDSYTIDFIDPGDHNKVGKAIIEAYRNGYATIEANLIAKNGKKVPFFLTGTRFVVENKEYIIGTGIDITERVEARNELEKSRELFKQLFKNSPIGIAMVSDSGEIQQVNPSFSRIFGYGEKDAQGENLDKLLTHKEKQGEALQFTHELFNGDSFQKESIRVDKDGKEIPVLIGGVPVEVENEVVAIYAIYVDISERKKLEDEKMELFIKEKEARERAEKAKLKLEDMFQHAPSASCILDGPEHRFTFVNDSYKKLIGNREVLETTIHEALPEIVKQGVGTLLDQVYNTGETYIGHEIPIELNNNRDAENLEEHILNYVYKPIKDDQDNIYAIYVEAIDVTEEVQYRKGIQQALKEKEILLQEIHHRVKNNLALITGLIDMQRFEERDADHLRKLTDIESRIFSIAQIHEVLYKNDNLAYIDFSDYLERLSALIHKTYNGASRDITVHFDTNKIELNINQAIPCGLLVNEILINAYEHAFKDRDKGTIRVTMKEQDGLVFMEIKDDGIGLSREIDPENPQTMGFTLIQRLSQQIEADITILSQKGTDIRFSFSKEGQKGSSSLMV